MLAQGLPVSSRNQTLSTFLTSWLEVVRHRFRPSTYDDYELNVRRIAEELGPVSLIHLTRRASKTLIDGSLLEASPTTASSKSFTRSTGRWIARFIGAWFSATQPRSFSRLGPEGAR